MQKKVKLFTKSILLKLFNLKKLSCGITSSLLFMSGTMLLKLIFRGDLWWKEEHMVKMMEYTHFLTDEEIKKQEEVNNIDTCEYE